MIEYKTIRELCSIVVDCPHSTPKWTEDGKIVVRNNNIKNGRINLTAPSLQTMSISGKELKERNRNREI